MRQLLLLLITLTLFGNVFGQKTEFSASLNSGLFAFVGSTAYQQAILITHTGSNGRTTIGNSIGSKYGLCYGLSFNLKRVTKKRYFFGVDVGYETLSSKALITQEDEYSLNSLGTGYNLVTRNISGKAFTNNSFLNVNPFIGYRYVYKKINFDLTVGMDVGYFLKTRESGSAKKIDGTNYTITYETWLKGMDTDFRPRFQLSTSYKNFGVYFGYAYGISDYNSRYNTHEIMTSKIIRFGVTYKII